MYTHEMTEANNQLITYCNTFEGDWFEMEGFANFVTAGMNRQLFELMNSKNESIKPNFIEFENLIMNINNLKELLTFLFNQRLQEIKKENQIEQLAQ